MIRFSISVFMVIFLVLQGMAMSLLPAKIVYSELLVTPHWVLCLIMIIAIFFDKDDMYHSVWYGLLFGLLIDVVYTGVLGVYMVTYAMTAYVIHGMQKWFHANFIASVLLAVFGVAIADMLLYVIYSFVQVTAMDWGDYTTLRLLPTVLANAVFFVLLYPLFKNRVEQWSDRWQSA
ncbi:rod shape-determining protein MreD [Halobacillus sp. A5]|uniref:rod shape-determining protein MreD n=1 Tax=Halobacillus sp. A5 TaxID=2880263 RepID=UPI0020A6A72F|nr:rod shape-determining protein MreD [Halobacillus sp. A5]MCP3025538.1 rod shape-determining protein MreD [Halobacillus sp. A5]